MFRLSFLPKAASCEGRCRGVVRLKSSPKAAYVEERCRGRPISGTLQEDLLERFDRSENKLARVMMMTISEFRIPVSGFRIPDSGFRILDSGF